LTSAVEKQGKSTIERVKKKILEAQRERLNLPADTPLHEVPVPKVLDIFAGGGAIPNVPTLVVVHLYR